MDKTKKKDWVKLLRENKAYCYIKPNRRKHESGFKCFEVGYLVMNKQNRVEDKLVLGTYSDHIQLYEYFDNSLQPNLDLTLDGYIRIYLITRGQNYWWGSDDFVVSSAQLKLLKEEK